MIRNANGFLCEECAFYSVVISHHSRQKSLRGRGSAARRVLVVYARPVRYSLYRSEQSSRKNPSGFSNEQDLWTNLEGCCLAGGRLDGSDMAMDFVRILGGEKTLHLDPSCEPNVCVNGKTLDSPQFRHNLIRLFDLPWWNCTWTVQEFVLARKLIFQCSRSEITRDDMCLARESLGNHMDHCCRQCLNTSGLKCHALICRAS